MGVIAAVINNKGGVGKTTVTCNLAHALALAGAKVLVVDLDSQCNTTQILLPSTQRVQHTFYDLLQQESAASPFNAYTYPTRCQGLTVLPNVPETAALEPELIRQAPASLFRLRHSLRDAARELFDITLLDNPPNIGMIVLGALHAADAVVVPVTAGSAFSIEGLLKAVRLIKEVRCQGNPDLNFLRLLINQVDRRTNISRNGVAQLRAAFRPEQVFATSIPATTLFEQAEMARQTVLEFSPQCAGARAYRNLAQELLAVLPLAPRGVCRGEV